MAVQLGSLLLSVVFFHRATLAIATVECYESEGGFTEGVWPHCQVVSENLLVYYGVSSDSEYLMLGLHAAGHSGWSALALAGNGGMRGASMAVVRKVDGVYVAEDRYSTAYDVPDMDSSQDVLLMFASEHYGGVSWGVLMPMDSCDEQDYPVQNHSRWMLWALGSGHDFDHSTFHGMNRGQFHANLITGPAEPRELTAVDEMDILMNDVRVEASSGSSDNSSSFVCQVNDLRVLINQTLGDVDTPLFHAVRFSAHIDPASKPFVHHMVLYLCTTEHPFFKHGHIIEDCETMPWDCATLLYAWAQGSNDGEHIVLPDNVGLPITTGYPWLTLQMHYYNPNHVQGVRDSSGVRFSLAREMRKINAGYVTFNGGVDPRRRAPIPPGVSDHELPPFVVASACTQQYSQEINLVGLVYHQHQIGKRMNIELFREGRNLGSLRLERMFDFYHQSIEEPAIRQVQPGDQFLVSCSYDSSSRTEPTNFGFETHEEMCFGAMLYWPVQPVLTFVHTTTDGKIVTWCNKHFVADPINTTKVCDIRGDVTSTAAASLAQTVGSSWEDLANGATAAQRRIGFGRLLLATASLGLASLAQS